MFGLLGGASATTKTTSTVDVITNVIMNTVQSCPVVVSNKQSIIVGDNASGVKISGNEMRLKVSLNAACVQQVTQNSQIINDIAQALSDHINASTSGLSLAVEAKTKLRQDLYTNIMNSVNMSTIQDCTTALTQSQELIVGKGATNVEISNNTFDASAEIVRNCMMTSLMTNSATASAINQIDGMNSAKNTNPISDILDSALSATSLYFFGILLLIIFLVYLFKDTISAVLFGTSESTAPVPLTATV